MKKEYIKPACEVVEIKTQCHLMQPSNVDTNLTGLKGYKEDGDDPEDSW